MPMVNIELSLRNCFL